MKFKKEFYQLEQLFEQKQYSSIIIKSILVFETGMKEIFLKYINSISNINDKRKILSIINQVGKNVTPLENMNFENLTEIEERLNIFFNYKKDMNIESFRIELININALIAHKKKIMYNKTLIKRLDAELFLISLKTFLLDFKLMEPLFTQKTLCNSCGNSIPENNKDCPFCGTQLFEQNKTMESENLQEKKSKVRIIDKHIIEQFVPRIRNKIEKIKKNKSDFWEAGFFNNSTMIYIPEETFNMGTNSEVSFPKERPSHTVSISSFWISKYEITFNQYDNFCTSIDKPKPYDEKWGRGNRPVINISWIEANAYCEWLSAKTGLTFRLPTEAEWELTAKGKEDRLYPWGNNIPTKDHANYNYNLSKTAEVGVYPSGISPYGLLDMAGNLREWCLDWYDEHYYKISQKFNPKGPIDGESRVIRGGGWGYDQSFLRTTDRNRWLPDDSSNEIGFRVVLEAK